MWVRLVRSENALYTSLGESNMKATNIIGFKLVFFLFISIFFLIPVCQSAESTADVSVDAAKKEELRKKIVGTAEKQTLDKEYIVGYRDILHVSVYGEGSMSASDGIQPQPIENSVGVGTTGSNFLRGRGTGIEVRIDGRISLRHIGDVSVVGLTLTQIADYLKELYSAIYDNPSLTVTLVQSNSQQYTVMGQVTAPGLFHLDYPITIVRAVARAGGFTEWANSEITVIRRDAQFQKGKRPTASKGKTFEFDFDEFLKGKNVDNNILIESGDVIVVH